jgi:hypothetical protein
VHLKLLIFINLYCEITKFITKTKNTINKIFDAIVSLFETKLLENCQRKRFFVINTKIKFGFENPADVFPCRSKALKFSVWVKAVKAFRIKVRTSKGFAYEKAENIFYFKQNLTFSHNFLSL